MEEKSDNHGDQGSASLRTLSPQHVLISLVAETQIGPFVSDVLLVVDGSGGNSCD
jgi:hypothetical protein